MTIVSSEDYVNSKPAPDGFLLAAERLGIAPADCLVFEDTDLGINAATAAGMKSVRIAPPWSAEIDSILMNCNNFKTVILSERVSKCSSIWGW